MPGFAQWISDIFKPAFSLRIAFFYPSEVYRRILGTGYRPIQL
jgi:hypothetical protein